MSFGVIIVVLLNLVFFVSSLSNRQIEIFHELDKKSYAHIDPWLLGMLTGQLLLIGTIFTFMLSDSGYVHKKTLKDKDNLLQVLSTQFESHSASKITPLDETCFTCLVVKRK